MLRLYEGKNFNSDNSLKTINVALGNLTMSGCQIRVGRTRNSPISQTGAYQSNQFAFYSSFSEKMLDNQKEEIVEELKKANKERELLLGCIL